MKFLLLAIAAAGIVMAREPAPPNFGKPATRASGAGGKVSSKHARRWSPLRLLRRAGETELDLAMRWSSWGIREPAAADGHTSSEKDVPSYASSARLPQEPEQR